MNLCVIPARGGSKRIPRKNIRKFAGSPIITWSIKTALESGLFSSVIVSTDDEEIAAVAMEAGAEVPFMRPSNLADDYSTSSSVVKHALEKLEGTGKVFKSVCCLYPAAPFVRVEDLAAGYGDLSESCDYVVTVARFSAPILRALRLGEDRCLSMHNSAYQNSRTQDLESAWYDAGQFYWGSAEAWRNEAPLFAGRSRALILPRERAIDIDTPEDWQMAEKLYHAIGETL